MAGQRAIVAADQTADWRVSAFSSFRLRLKM
jgi:hypothetical protein